MTLTDDKTPRVKNQARVWTDLGPVVAGVMVVVMWTTGERLTAAEMGSVGQLTGRHLPAESKPAWKKAGGTARESIEDGRWVVRDPKNFCRRLLVGDYQQTDGQKNEVRFEWGTNCRDNRRADGFSIHTQGRRLRLHPIHRPNRPDLLLVGVRGGMGPDIIASHVDLTALPGFNARKPNRYLLRWVTQEINDFRFELSINGTPIAELTGEPRVVGRDVSIGFEFRGGTHSISSVAWDMNRGGRRVVSPGARTAVRRLAMGYRELFLDDLMVAELRGIKKVLHRPIKYSRNPVIRHHQRPWQKFRAQLYGTVLYIPEEKIFKMWYLAGARFPDEAAITLDGKPRVPNFQMLAYAESRDGLNWTLPDLGLVSFNGSRHNNLCRFSRENAEGVGVVYDPHDPDPARRYKAFYWEHSVRSPHKIPVAVAISAMSVSFSADGKNWTNHPGNPVIPQASDTGHQALWDPFRKVYVAYGRFGAGGRKIARSESRDFINWSPSQLVFAADAADTKSRGGRPQFYGMGTTIYEGTYIGLPWLFWENSSNRLDVQLASSRDGIHWQRAGNRQTLIPNGKRGTWDGGCIFTASQPLQVKDDTIYIYYSGLSLDHEEPRPSRRARPEYGESSIGVATLRRDGFVSMRAGEKPATLVTGLFQWPAGRRLHLNVDASKGGVRVGVLDQNGRLLDGFVRSKLISGDRTDVVVEWTGSGEPKAKSVQLKFEMTNADLYSYWLK